jgi:endoglucanase
MRKTLFQITALIALALTINGLTAQTKQVPKAEHLKALPSTVDLGAYDNFHKLDSVRTITYEHIWCDWARYTPGKLLPQLKEITAKGRIPLVTIEPYPIGSIGSAETLLPDIGAGKYDSVTSALAKEIKSLGSPVLVRWGPEMEYAIKPWSVKAPADYIAAYRHFVAKFKKISPSSSMVWSPVGEAPIPVSVLLGSDTNSGEMTKGCEQYYPGDDVVDYAGFSLYEVPAVSINWAGHPRSFADWMNQKYPRFVAFNKPIIIAELGVWDTAARQAAWMQAAFAAVPNYPLLKVLVYFNTQDLVSWKKWGGMGAPNWLINQAVFTN